MPKLLAPLSALKVQKLAKTPGRHAVGGCPGLLLQVGDNGAASWLLRALVGGRRRDIGLGSFQIVDLAAARERARKMRERMELEGLDPVAERKELKAAVQADAKSMTFDDAAKACHAKKSAEFRNEKFKADWLSAVTRFASPKLGKKPVAEVTVQDVFSVIEPVWEEKPETASRLRGRIETILGWADTAESRDRSNPARWKGNLSNLLANPKKLIKRAKKPRRTVPWQEMPGFMVDLRKRNGMSARCLEFAILTMGRSMEVREATWSEIDLKAKLWTVHGSRMKAEKRHRQPLSDAAISLLKSLPKSDATDLLFPNTENKALSDMALLEVMRKMKSTGTPHGTARSSFKDWARNEAKHPDEVSELCLAHVSTDATRAAYARDELLAQRAALLNDWAQYLGGQRAKKKK